MLALIDGDIVAFRNAASTMLEGDVKVPASWGIVRARCDDMMRNILAATCAEGGKYQVWLSGDRNFRYDLYPEYKANRKAPHPRYLEDLKEYLIVEWGARVADGVEADDELGIAATANPDSIICTIDKDLQQVPGWHHNFVKGTTHFVTEQQGMVFFYRQMLIGDSSDNVRGVDGIGSVKAGRRISESMGEREAFDSVRSAFRSDDRFVLAGDLLHIQRRSGERWSQLKAPWISSARSAPAQEAESMEFKNGSTDDSLDSITPQMTTAMNEPTLISGTPTEASFQITPDLRT